MNDQSEAPRIYARKGEAVTCINGHPICEMARDVYCGEGRAPEQFTNWHQPEPDRATLIVEIRCAECRGVWIRGDTQLHFAEGWR